MASHHIIGSEVRRVRHLSPGLGSMRIYPARRSSGGILHTAGSFAAVALLVLFLAAVAARFG